MNTTGLQGSHSGPGPRNTLGLLGIMLLCKIVSFDRFLSTNAKLQYSATPLPNNVGIINYHIYI